MSKKYFSGNVIYLPINPRGLGPATMYITATVNGDIFMNELYTSESLEKRFKAGEIKECKMIIPSSNSEDNYKRLW